MRNIVNRKTWGARAPRNVTNQDKRSVGEVFIHWPGDVGSMLRHDPDMDDGEGGALSSLLLVHEDAELQDHRIKSPTQEAAYMRGVQNFHMDAPDHRWSDIGYNYVVFPSGRIYRGRGWTHVPAGQLNHNQGTDAVCCILGTADHVIPDPMKDTLRDFVRWAERYADREIDVRPHSAVTPTSCPGPVLRAFVRELNRI